MWLALIALSVAAETVELSLSVPQSAPSQQWEARGRWLGQDLVVPLQGKGVLRGTLEGEELRYLPLEIWAGAPGAQTQMYTGMHTLPFGEARVDLVWEPPAQELEEIVQALPGGKKARALRAGAKVGVGFLWWSVALLGLLWLRARPKGPAGHTPPWMQHPAGIYGMLLGLAVLWSYPAILASPEALVGRNFDAPGTLWSIAATPSLLAQGLLDSNTGWPEGGDYRRFDSYTLLLVAWALQWMDAARLHGWIQILGLALSGTAAAMFCKEVGAKGLWPFAGGVLYAFSGLAATVLLEGHVYHLLDPWLPLFALLWWRAMGPQGRWQQGALAGLLYLLVAASTAYQGVAGAMLTLCFFGAGLLRRGRGVLLPALAAGGVVALGMLPLLWAVRQGQGGGGVSVVIVASLSTLSVAHSELDTLAHSYVVTLSGLGLGLMGLAGYHGAA